MPRPFRKSFVGFDLTKNIIKNAAMNPDSVAPANPVVGELWTDTTNANAAILKFWDGDGWQVPSRKYATAIGDGAALSYSVAHPLSSTDVTVQTYEIVNVGTATAPVYNNILVEAAITVVDKDKVKIEFDVAPAANSIRVVVSA